MNLRLKGHISILLSEVKLIGSFVVWWSRARYDSESGKCSTTWFILRETQGKRACVLEVVHEASLEHR